MLRCGFYEMDVTPCLGSDIPGYYIRRPSNGVQDKLYVRAMAIEVDGVCALVMSVDAITLLEETRSKAVEKITAATGVPNELILCSATHSHTAGYVKSSRLGTTRDELYMEMIARKIGDCGILAYQNLVPAKAKYAKSDVYGISFVRNYRMKDGTIRTNPGFQNPDILEPIGTIDPEFPMLFLFDEEDKPMGALTNFALHHDCVQGTKYSADYSGVLAKEMKQSYGENFTTVFLNGACGNINHLDVSRPQSDFYAGDGFCYSGYHIKIGTRLAEEARKMYESAIPFNIDVVSGRAELFPIKKRTAPIELLHEAEELIRTTPYQALKDIDSAESVVAKRANAEDIVTFFGLPEEVPVMIQALRLGDMMLYGTSGEVYVEFGKYTKENSPTQFNMFAELCGGVVSVYIPTPEICASKTAYEGQIPVSALTEECGQIMSDEMLKLAKEIM
ncbi:MAG: hypothetical protein II997_03550 [Clostridia bacterium]|nr:hypothetical protein [Clostridia bacterium]